jgi:tripartite-type tricarboxylate transporter receptor subunit TctC
MKIKPHRNRSFNESIIAVLLGIVTLLAAAPNASAQAYPAKAVRLVVGFPPGGNTDVIARIVANRLSMLWDSQVIVDNRPGADASIAMGLVAKAPPDGYTLYLIQSGVAINPALYKNVPFDPIKDFAPITLIGDVPSLIAIHPSVPARSLKEFIALAKARKGELSYAATSSPTMLATELFIRTAGIDIVRVNYKGSAPAINALLTGDVQLVISGIGSLLPLTKIGKVRTIAITSQKRSQLAPEIPTAIEGGLKGYVASVWCGIAAPGATQRPIIDKVNADMRRLLAEPDTKSRLLVQGIEPMPNTPEQFSEMIRSEIAKWERVVRESGVKID